MDSTHIPADSMPARFDALKFGLFRSVTVSGQGPGGALLNTRAWNNAAENGYPVGDCRNCGYNIFALPTEQVGNVTWYSAGCRNCGKEVVSANAEVLLRSSRHSEMPQGFWEGRTGTRGRFA